MSLSSRLSALTTTLVLIASCAGPPVRPVAELTRAQTLIEQAEKTGAPRFAASELEQARGKVAAAEAAAARGEQETARRLATEAALDAEYAGALAAAGAAKQAADEIEKSTESLREEAARRPDGGITERP